MKAHILSLLVVLAPPALAIPIVGSSAATLDQHDFMFEFHVQYLNYTAVWDTATDAWQPMPSGQWARSLIALPQIYYGLFDRLTLRLTTPILRKDVKPTAGSKQLVSAGLGDCVLDFKAKVFTGEDGEPMTSLFGGVRLPTATRQNPPLGDGSTDYVLGLLATKKVRAFSSSLMLGYWLNTGNPDVSPPIDAPDQFFYNVSLEYGLPFHLAIVTEYDGSLTFTSPLQHTDQVCVGLQHRTLKNLVLEGSVAIPVWARGGYRPAPWPFVGGFVTF